MAQQLWSVPDTGDWPYQTHQKGHLWAGLTKVRVETAHVARQSQQELLPQAQAITEHKLRNIFTTLFRTISGPNMLTSLLMSGVLVGLGGRRVGMVIYLIWHCLIALS